MDKTYKDALMYKEAGLEKLFPNIAQRIARSKGTKIFGKSKKSQRLLAALLKDLPIVAKSVGKGIGKGSWTATKWLAEHDPGLLMTTNRAGKLTVSIPKALGWGTLGAYKLWPQKVKDTVTPVVDSSRDWAKQKFNDAIDYINDTRNGVGTRVVAGPKGSKASLFNPVSGLTGGVDWVPQKYIDFVQRYIPGQAGATTAHMTMKAGAMALLAAGLVGGYRTLRHVKDLGEIEAANRPGKDLAGQLSATFSGDISGGEDLDKAASVKKAQEEAPKGTDIRSSGNFTTQNLTATALPIGTFLLAAGLAYKGVDSVFDKIRNKRLDKEIADKDQAIKRLITARAQIAKGGQNIDAANAAVAPIEEDVYTKAAALDKEADIIPQTVQLVGTLSAAVLLASAIGSYAYTSAGDENNLKYKAYKKALQEYAKAKSGITPITVAPKNAPSYFAAIDAAGQKEVPTARQLPAIDTDALNKPISISI